MRRAGIISWCAVVFFIALSCSDSPSGPAVNWGTPVGMPDWYSGEYDWIDSAYEQCASVTFFQPKVIVNVGGISPDGNVLLGIHRNRELFLYDLETQRVTQKIGQAISGFHDARWSNGGRYIVGSRLIPSINLNVLYEPYWYDIHTGAGTILDIADSLEPTGGNIAAMPGDTSLLIYKYMKDIRDVPPFYAFSVHSATVSPLSIDAVGGTAVVHPDYYIWFRHYFISQDFSEKVDLCVAPLGQSGKTSTYRLPNVLGVVRAALSHDGNWLSAPMTVRLPDDRFLSASRCMGLGIIDLRPGSPYRYQIYAFYPDHTNASKLCVNSYTLPGSAWSPDNRYVYHEQIRLSDTTVQIVRREVATGKVEVLSDFRGVP